MANNAKGRANVNLSDLNLTDDQLRELLGVADDDTWEAMSNAQKLLILAKRGIKATQESLKKSQGE